MKPLDRGGQYRPAGQERGGDQPEAHEVHALDHLDYEREGRGVRVGPMRHGT